MLRVYFVMYQITVTQPFLAALCIFLKGNSEQNSNKAMCPCKYNEDFFSSVPNLPSLSGAHQKVSSTFCLMVYLPQQKNLIPNSHYLQKKALVTIYFPCNLNAYKISPVGLQSPSVRAPSDDSHSCYRWELRWNRISNSLHLCWVGRNLRNHSSGYEKTKERKGRVNLPICQRTKST